VYGDAVTYGVYGEGATGVAGHSTSNVGVSGISDAAAGYGVYGHNTGNGYGVYGTASAYGVYGEGATGVAGHSTSNVGVSGISDAATGYGVFGRGATGVHANGDNTGVYGVGLSGAGRGGVFGGIAAPLQLLPASASTHPTSGFTGDLFVDSTARLWFCKGGTTWVELAPATIWSLAAGWNLVGIAQGSVAASAVVTGVLSASGGNLAAIYHLTNGQWSPPVILRRGGSPTGTDFSLVPGVGYLLYTDRTASLSLAATGGQAGAATGAGHLMPHAGDGAQHATLLPPMPPLP
jgi:hypothetical protein